MAGSDTKEKLSRQEKRVGSGGHLSRFVRKKGMEEFLKKFKEGKISVIYDSLEIDARKPRDIYRI